MTALNFGSEKKAVIICIGSRFVKLGLSAEAYPRHVIPTRFTDEDQREYTFRLAPGQKRATVIEWRAPIELFLQDVFYNLLQVNPGERRVVLVESVLCSPTFRDALLYVLYERFRVLSVLTLLAPCASLCPLEMATALVVDVGFSDTAVVPVFERCPLIYATAATPVAAEMVLRNLDRLLDKFARRRPRGKSAAAPATAPAAAAAPTGDAPAHDTAAPPPPAAAAAAEGDAPPPADAAAADAGATEAKPAEPVPSPAPAPAVAAAPAPAGPPPSVPDDDPGIDEIDSSRAWRWPVAVLEEILARMCFVMPPTQPETGPVVKSDFTVPVSADEQLDVPGSVRTHATSVLFQSDNTRELPSVPEAVLDSLLHCPADIRGTLSQNIVLTGGVPMLPGFGLRLKAECDALLTAPRYAPLAALKGRLRFVPLSFKANYLDWLGASIYGSLPEYLGQSLTLEQYSVGERLPDWSQATALASSRGSTPTLALRRTSELVGSHATLTKGRGSGRLGSL